MAHRPGEPPLLGDQSGAGPQGSQHARSAEKGECRLKVERAQLFPAHALQGGTGMLPGLDPAPAQRDLLRGPVGEDVLALLHARNLTRERAGRANQLTAQDGRGEAGGAGRGGAFQYVSLAQLSDELAIAELSGHMKGAWTGALRDQPGPFELAHGGTVHLDEVGNAPAKGQQVLLRVLDRKQVQRVGDTRWRPVDVRLIASTNQDLDQLVRDGLFRADLLSRFGEFVIRMPPLRERRDEILPLARGFLEAAAAELGRQPPKLSPCVERIFLDAQWPGNIRGLLNVPVPGGRGGGGGRAGAPAGVARDERRGEAGSEGHAAQAAHRTDPRGAGHRRREQDEGVGDRGYQPRASSTGAAGAWGRMSWRVAGSSEPGCPRLGPATDRPC